MIKLNKLELDLLKKAVGWYYKEFKDKELRAAIVKERPTIADLEKMKDAVDIYHNKGHVRGKEQHVIMESLYKKFGEKVKSTNERQVEEKKKTKIRLLKEQEEKERKRKEQIEKEEQRILNLEKMRLAKQEKAKAELEKEKFKLSDVFVDVSPDKDNNI